MTRTRRLNQAPQQAGTLSIQMWNRLMRKAIEMAEAAGDTRKLRVLRAAQQQGKTRDCLKRMSIISEADLQREFGPKK